jgi:hypothetical protein
LIPLSGIGLCDALITTPTSAPKGVGQIGDTGGRQNPEPDHVDAGRSQTGDDGVLEELPRDPRVATHDRHRAQPGVTAVVDQHASRGSPQVDRELGGDRAVRETADAVGAEDPLRHRGLAGDVSAC